MGGAMLNELSCNMLSVYNRIALGLKEQNKIENDVYFVDDVGDDVIFFSSNAKDDTDEYRYIKLKRTIKMDLDEATRMRIRQGIGYPEIILSYEDGKIILDTQAFIHANGGQDTVYELLQQALTSLDEVIKVLSVYEPN